LPNTGHVEREKTDERDDENCVYGLHNKVILYKLIHDAICLYINIIIDLILIRYSCNCKDLN